MYMITELHYSSIPHIIIYIIVSCISDNNIRRFQVDRLHIFVSLFLYFCLCYVLVPVFHFFFLTFILTNCYGMMQVVADEIHMYAFFLNTSHYLCHCLCRGQIGKGLIYKLVYQEEVT